MAPKLPPCVYIPFFNYPVYQFEWLLVFLVVAACVIVRCRAAQWLRKFDAALHWLARHRRAAVLVSGIVPLAVRVALLPVFPIPDPSVHDEFSHLLLADTFAHGRVTNPTHKFWQHFETIHVISQPTYTSMYPPALGLSMAAAQVVAGHPWWGVWGGVGLMCSMTCWALQAWLPPKWAFWGALLLGLRTGIYSFYMNSYFGGQIPAIGGALVIGALPRALGAQRPMQAALLGLGLVILANSRPYESAFMGAGVCLVAAVWIARRRKFNLGVFARKVAVPCCAVLAAGALATLYYCWRVTGNPLVLPYQVNRATYGWPEHLALLPAVNVHHRHQSMRDHFLFERSTRSYYATPQAFLRTTGAKVQTAWRFLFGPALTPALLFVPLVLKSRRLVPLVILAALLSLAYLTELFLYPQYLGPVIALLFVFAMQGLRHLYVTAGRRRPEFLFGIRMIPVICATMVVVRLFGGPLARPVPFWDNPKQGHERQRARILSQLERLPGRHLVFVRYSPQHNFHQEWVYNSADIDGSKVVWAREMDAACNERLRQYFRDRQAWVLEADQRPARLVPYSSFPEVSRSPL